ncbi:MAG: SDR family NAD(P)-dependent oxidoreductase [Pseudomonadota bacterium]
MTDTASNLKRQFPSGGTAVVIAASGGIGAALHEAIKASGAFTTVIGTSRSGGTAVDLTDEASIVALAETIKASGQDLRLVFDASGYLHGPQGNPEKSWNAIDAQTMAYQFAVNTIGPALLVKHLIPLLPRESRSVFATISAKVGSISDNRLGGWYGYRAAKAGLNQIVKTTSIELARKRAEAVCIALHPGTVKTQLSDPFAKAGVRLQEPHESAAAMLNVVASVEPADSGSLIAYDGTRLPY